MGRQGRAVIFTRPGVPLSIRDHAVPEPGPGELLVRLDMAGICGSDIHRLAGDTPCSGEPVGFGHEATGTVEAIGTGAGQDSARTPLAPGDRVYWFPVPLCGECAPCREDRSISFCEKFVWPLPPGGPNANGFQDLATIGPGVPVYRIPEGTSSAAVIAFGCAMPTAIGGMKRLGSVEGVVVVQGAGPLGLAATLLAARRRAGDHHRRSRNETRRRAAARGFGDHLSRRGFSR